MKHASQRCATVRIIDRVFDLGNCPAVAVEKFLSQPSEFLEGGQVAAACRTGTMPREAPLSRRSRNSASVFDEQRRVLHSFSCS